ncbi:TonB-dependent receptor plug domain-containing protein [Pseudomarimonas salicorniae]|uniref:TonB-dependent receptor n=1 Tax=Pseudomarimonas salicorniae TaxID=2933270 RepID=A0ABT0GM32_9GAMM|nr:TonB-dependent receptor [Lysobacter sp. CAU 1642]MCK7595483.1 TonB-dependent receptor [Lysobacter sp. CAU 1642]
MPKLSLLSIAVLAALNAAPAHAQDPAEGEDARALDTVVVTGTRVSNRSAGETPAPIDVVGVETLQRTGAPELNQALSVALPSFNFPRPGLADGTDTVRPATLRGLAPDQSLVLVNSKRRHAAALVNVNGTVGRGSSAVDLNTIPMAAVQSVEVLRDGASAQYGSDAIAGVINVILRRAAEGGNATVSYSQRDTEYTTPTTPPPAGAIWSAPSRISRDLTDGETVTVSAWKGFALGDAGYFTLSAEYKDAERTERGGYDYRQQYPLVNGAFDPREANFDRFNAWYGEPEVEQKTVFANFGIDYESGSRLYGWASLQDREARSAGFYRRALDARNVIEIYPDGFLPIIAPDVDDSSAAIGYEWQWNNWFMDTSLVYGKNEMQFTIENTLNRSLGPASGTEFDAGGFDYDQLVFNFSGVNSLDVDGLASALNVAAGIEARRESYSIFAGEPDSYRNGGVLLNGNPTASGAQVFPGFRPSNEVNEDRTAVGVYVDFEANLTENLLGSAAVRAEDYSDFGSNLTGKLAMRYDFSTAFALRGSMQNGFRAPSPQQQFFTATSTNFINGVPFDITTFPVDDPIARALGARPLDAEESVNFSLGAVMSLGDVTVTVDAYRIDIDDRIVLSENLVATNVRDFLTSRGFIGIGGGRFFINGVDTETQGVDVVVSWPWDTENLGKFDFTLAGNYNETEVTRVPTTAELSALDPAPVLFGRINVLTFEEGNPKDKLAAIVNWSQGMLGATLRATRYGEVLDPGTSAATDFRLPSKTLVDLEGRVQFTDSLRLAIGAENVFDQYPEAFPISRNGTGNTPFSNYSPFGRSGRLVYARLSLDF